jgi:hypothetical protein
LAVLPRYFLKPCFYDASHCANVCKHDDTAVEDGKKLLRDLESLNEQLAKRLNGKNTQFLFTADLLTGKQHCSMGDLGDCLFECWRSDPVHGDKSAYLKLAVSLLDFLDPKPRLKDSRGYGKKRHRSASPPTPSSPPSDSTRRGRDEQVDDRHGSSFRPRPRLAYSSYPGDFRRPGGSGGYRRR